MKVRRLFDRVRVSMRKLAGQTGLTGLTGLTGYSLSLFVVLFACNCMINGASIRNCCECVEEGSTCHVWNADYNYEYCGGSTSYSQDDELHLTT